MTNILANIRVLDVILSFVYTAFVVGDIEGGGGAPWGPPRAGLCSSPGDKRWARWGGRGDAISPAPPNIGKGYPVVGGATPGKLKHLKCLKKFEYGLVNKLP